MLNVVEIRMYKNAIALYKNGNRFTPGTREYDQIVHAESRFPIQTSEYRKIAGLNVSSLTSTEFAPAPKPENETPTRGQETLFAPVQSLTFGLPPGTTPTGAKPTTPGTTPGTNESFISKYKMPLIIGAVAIGYFFLRKK